MGCGFLSRPLPEHSLTFLTTRKHNHPLGSVFLEDSASLTSIRDPTHVATLSQVRTGSGVYQRKPRYPLAPNLQVPRTEVGMLVTAEGV